MNKIVDSNSKPSAILFENQDSTDLENLQQSNLLPVDSKRKAKRRKDF